MPPLESIEPPLFEVEGDRTVSRDAFDLPASNSPIRREASRTESSRGQNIWRRSGLSRGTMRPRSQHRATSVARRERALGGRRLPSMNPRPFVVTWRDDARRGF